MKATGIIRKVDPLGRIVLPIELRRGYRFNNRDPIEIFVEEDQIILKKYDPQISCLVTGEISSANFSLANGKITLSREGANQLMKELEKNLAFKLNTHK